MGASVGGNGGGIMGFGAGVHQTGLVMLYAMVLKLSRKLL
jgi:hypothetical protein